MRSLWILLLSISAVPLVGQVPSEEKIIREPIDRLFKGMHDGDTTLVHSAFEENVTMATIYKDTNGAPMIRNESGIKDFLKAVGTPHAAKWSEPIWNLFVQVDGNFAQAWASYAFYAGNKFSHCGVDAFHLFKGADGQWKIFHLTDTRQKEGCQIPPEISNKFK
jgi:hypothetical protein